MMHDNGCFVKSLRAELTALCYTQTAYSGRLPLRLVAEVGMGERFTAALRLGPRPMDDLGEDPGTVQDTAPSLFPWAPNSSQGEGQDRILLHCPPDVHHSTKCCLNDRLTVALWQLVAWRRGHCRANQ